MSHELIKNLKQHVNIDIGDIVCSDNGVKFTAVTTPDTGGRVCVCDHYGKLSLRDKSDIYTLPAFILEGRAVYLHETVLYLRNRVGEYVVSWVVPNCDKLMVEINNNTENCHDRRWVEWNNLTFEPQRVKKIVTKWALVYKISETRVSGPYNTKEEALAQIVSNAVSLVDVVQITWEE